MGWGSGNLGGGSGGLNFKIVGGTSEPSNPKENTIWVITDVPITSWIFSPTQPEPPADGKDGPVWFLTGTSSGVAFNALRKNAIEVHPSSAKQYIGGEWVSVEAQSYQNGKLIGWRKGFVFKDGEYGEISGFTCVRATSAIENKNIVLKSAGNVYCHAYSNEKIDLRGINAINVVFETGSIGYTAYFGVMQNVPAQNSKDGTINGLDVVKTVSTGWKNFSGTYSLDVSSLNGDFYLVFNFSGSGNGSGVLNVSQISYD